VRFYLSADQSLDPDDLIIGDLEVKPLDPGDEQSRSFHVALPRGVSATGFSVIAFVDADNIVFESNERNNVVASDPIQ
jgi:subtilase family serine protease